MAFLDAITAKWQAFCDKVRPGFQLAGRVVNKIRDIFRLIGLWIWRLRKIFLAIPIVWLALYLARLSNNVLPDMVGINLQTTGEFSRLITKEAAVYGPLAVTAVCLLTMLLSRKTLYPWIICLFSMVLPVLILITNMFPA